MTKKDLKNNAAKTMDGKQVEDLAAQADVRLKCVPKTVKLASKPRVFGAYTEFLSVNGNSYATKVDSITVDGSGVWCFKDGDAVLFPYNQVCYVEFG